MIPIPEERIKKFERMAFGMFIHWGLYSQLGIGEWAQYSFKIPKNEYTKLKDKFTANEFDPYAIVKLAKKAGMKYITLTTRHHEGFSLYDTRGLSNFDAVNSPASRDLVAEFIEACRSEDITPMLYHTTLDWYQEDFEEDFNSYLEYLRKSVEVLCTNYGQIGGLWFDGNWSKPDSDWKLNELYGTIRQHQPETLIINNTGINALGEMGHQEIDSVTYEQGLPSPINREGMPKYVAGEMCQTINGHWSVAKNDFRYKSPEELIENLCLCRKVGANYLLNIGPTAQGGIVKMQEATLEIVGEWMKINGKPIYEGKPCTIKGKGKDFALQTEEGKIYLFIFNLGIDGHANVTTEVGGIGPRAFSGLNRSISSVRWLDNGEDLSFSQDIESGMFCFNATGFSYGENLVVRVAELS